MTAVVRSNCNVFDLYSGCAPVEVFCRYTDSHILSISQVSQVSDKRQGNTLIWATTVSCHINPVSVFTAIQSFNSVYTELLAASFYKLEIHMAVLRYL